FLAELVPAHIRGRAFAFNQLVSYSVVPVVALLSWLLVPTTPFGYDGWRFVVLIGAAGAVAVWFIRIAVPESPRWLAQQGRLEEADRITSRIEAQVAADLGAPLPPPRPAVEPVPAPRPRFADIWTPEYRGRTIMHHDDGVQLLPDDRLLRFRELGADIARRPRHHRHAQPALFVHHRHRQSDRTAAGGADRRQDRAQMGDRVRRDGDRGLRPGLLP